MARTHSSLILGFLKARKGNFFQLERLLYKIVTLSLSPFIKPDWDAEQLYLGFSGRYYEGNLKSILDASIERGTILSKKIEIFWITSHADTRKLLLKNNIRVYKKMSLRKLSLFLKTHIWLDDHGPALIPVPKRSEDFRVQVWHGIPFKGFAGNELTKKIFNEYDLHPVSSQWLADYYINGIGVHSEKVSITGYPRSDDLINTIHDRKTVLHNLGLSTDKKTLLYAPTWAQDSGKTKPLFPWGNDEEFIKDFITFIEKNNLQCIIRTHPNWNGMTPTLRSLISKSSNLIFNSVKNEPDTNKILTATDVCMTDYSSIVNDFIVLNRPMVFLEPELELFEYGFALKPEERAGAIVRDKQSMFDAILCSVEHPDEYEQQRKIISDKIHFQLDGHASDRTLNEIEQRILKLHPQHEN